MMKRLAAFVLITVICMTVTSAETYRSVPLSKLKFEGLPQEVTEALDQAVDSHHLRRLDARIEGESCFGFAEPEDGALVQSEARVFFRGDAKLPLTGVVDMALDYEAQHVKTFRFTIVEGSTEEVKEEDYIEQLRAVALSRHQDALPGAAWFRHQAGHPDGDGSIVFGEFSSTFDIFGGGRAISDNLALDRDLILGTNPEHDEELIRIDTITGVTVKAIDWSAQLPKEEVPIDPLALAIPEDQHAVFAPSLPGLLALLNRLESETEMLEVMPSESAYRGLLQRYRRQLGLDLSDAAARLLPVGSVAVTGGDPYFATGTDVAILMETGKPEALLKALELAVLSQTGVKPQRHRDDDGLERLSFVVPEKGISSHLCRLGSLVFVTNSMAQVRRLSEVADQLSPALGKTDEFKVFRGRYPKANEQAFVFLSDATIRRWAGPVTRIGASRRNRALAALNELTCRGIAPCGKEDEFSPLLGRIAMVNGRAISEHYGSADFLTPISELGLGEVSQLEKEAYEQWREGYESGWKQAFDPIAIQLKYDDRSMDIDLTVLPLSVNSEIKEIMEVTGKAKLSPRARTRPEGSILHLACAIDSTSAWLNKFEQELVPMMPELKIKPLSWVGESVSVDFLDSLFWEGLGRMGVDSQLGHLPVVARVEVKSKIKLGLFLTALRTLIQTSAPDAMVWTNRKHGERSYVVVGPQETEEFEERFQVCYAIVDKALLIALSERNLKRAMDLEQMELTQPQLEQLPQADGLMMDADPKLLNVFDRLAMDASAHSRHAQRSWKAIAILNEWRRRFPDRDPVMVHQDLFGVSLGCPGGKGYRWNKEHLTMESVVYGHRGAPREPDRARQGITRYGRIHSGVDFADDGLRLRLHLGPKVDLPSLPEPAVGEIIGKGVNLAAYKAGRVLSYEGQDEFGQHNWKFEVLSMEETPEGLLVRTSEPWSDEEDEGKWLGSYLVGKDGIWQMGGKDEFNSTTYSKPPLDMPLELRLNEVHRHQVVGEDVYEENGEKEVDASRSRQELRVLGTETIVVKAGKFENCVVIERRTESLWGDYYDLVEGKEWYHPGTGLIKTIDQNGYGGELFKIEEKQN